MKHTTLVISPVCIRTEHREPESHSANVTINICFVTLHLTYRLLLLIQSDSLHIPTYKRIVKFGFFHFISFTIVMLWWRVFFSSLLAGCSSRLNSKQSDTTPVRTAVKLSLKKSTHSRRNRIEYTPATPKKKTLNNRWNFRRMFVVYTWCTLTLEFKIRNSMFVSK